MELAHEIDPVETIDEVAETRRRQKAFDRGQGDRFRAQGQDLTLSAAVQVVQAQKGLTGDQALRYAALFEQVTGNLTDQFLAWEE